MAQRQIRCGSIFACRINQEFQFLEPVELLIAPQSTVSFLQASAGGTHPKLYANSSDNGASAMPPPNPSLRQLYLEWVEEQIEDYKDSVSRSDLLRLADEVIRELEVNGTGQYQLTEVLLCTAVDRKIFRLLKLPGYRAWSSTRPSAPRPNQRVSEVPLEVEVTQVASAK